MMPRRLSSHGAVADPTKILNRSEMADILADFKRKAVRSPSTRKNLIIFRLAACCGLRASEIAQLQVGDVRTESTRPHLRIRRGAAKRGRPRIVPLWWDGGTLPDIASWKQDRLDRGARPTGPVLRPVRPVGPLSRRRPVQK